MDDSMRVSDADRERVAARLREHFAEGRLSSEELDERMTVALSAKTFGELRHVLADLPEPVPVSPQGWQAGPRAGQPWAGHPWAGQPWAGHPSGGHPLAGHPWARPGAVPRWAVARRGPRIFPLAIILLIAAVVIPGAGWLFLAFVKVLFVFWLLACLAGIFAAIRFRRNLRRYWQAGYNDRSRQFQ